MKHTWTLLTLALLILWGCTQLPEELDLNGPGTGEAPSITSQPQDQTVQEGGTATFQVEADGSPAPEYQWQKNGVDISGADKKTYTIPNVTSSDGGNYKVVVTNSEGSETSRTAVLTVSAMPPQKTPPSIITHPKSDTVDEGGSATFTAQASGNPAPSYQWKKDGSNISSATSASYTIANVQVSHGGVYTVTASNSEGSETSNQAVLIVNVASALSAPEITRSPGDTAVDEGADITFSVQATGNPTPAYQWRKDGTNITGATSASYTISSVTSSDEGAYTVRVSNSEGTKTSSPANLTVNTASTLAAPQITKDPADTTIDEGADITFSVQATGNPAPAYQWKKDGTSISGATSKTYTISGAAVSDEGTYTVLVSNSEGTKTSSPAVLTVNQASQLTAPRITLAIHDTTVDEGQSISFTIRATGNPAPDYQWKKDGDIIPDGVSAVYTISSASASDAGAYTVSVSNSEGSDSSTAVLDVQPLAAVDWTGVWSAMLDTTINGADITFSQTLTVGADGSYLLAYDITDSSRSFTTGLDEGTWQSISGSSISTTAVTCWAWNSLTGMLESAACQEPVTGTIEVTIDGSIMTMVSSEATTQYLKTTQPSIGTSVESLYPYTYWGFDAPDGGFLLWNSGAGALNYTITVNDGGYGWLSCFPAAGTAGHYGSPETIGVYYNTSLMDYGIYGGIITISANGAVAKTIYVALTVDPGMAKKGASQGPQGK